MWVAEKDNLILTIEQDDLAIDPREDDNLGTMICFHRNYALGDDHNYSDPRDFLEELVAEHCCLDKLMSKLDVEEDDYDAMEIVEYIEQPDLLDLAKEIAVILPLYLYDHSGITISTSPFSCHWDSGQVGWIYCLKEDIAKEFQDVKDKEKLAESFLQVEVRTYDCYIRGETYYCKLEEKITCPHCNHTELRLIDAWYGFTGPFNKNQFAEPLEITGNYSYLLDYLEQR